MHLFVAKYKNKQQHKGKIVFLHVSSTLINVFSSVFVFLLFVFFMVKHGVCFLQVQKIFNMHNYDINLQEHSNKSLLFFSVAHKILVASCK